MKKRKTRKQKLAAIVRRYGQNVYMWPGEAYEKWQKAWRIAE